MKIIKQNKEYVYDMIQEAGKHIIGSIVKYKNEKYLVVESNGSCKSKDINEKCQFYNKCEFTGIKCSKRYREDNKDICFIKT